MLCHHPLVLQLGQALGVRFGIGPALLSKPQPLSFQQPPQLGPSGLFLPLFSLLGLMPPLSLIRLQLRSPDQECLNEPDSGGGLRELNPSVV